MKFLAGIVLLLFITFLSVPTVVGIVEDKADISMFYSLTEEEVQKELMEIKAGPEEEFEFLVFIQPNKTTLIKTGNLQKHDNVFEEIFSPPPELI